MTKRICLLIGVFQKQNKSWSSGLPSPSCAATTGHKRPTSVKSPWTVRQLPTGSLIVLTSLMLVGLKENPIQTQLKDVPGISLRDTHVLLLAREILAQKAKRSNKVGT
ncbi:hypothetical protein BTVI_82548 [Pitangus sulphuratus]|nr:hypothetical protein BTVI_82548 [Pitangus sulphuratus]